MKLIDRVKLDSHRQMIDGDVAEICTERCISRPQAYADLLASMSLHLRLVFAANDKVVGAVVNLDLLHKVDALRHGPLLKGLPSKLTDEVWAQVSNTLCVGLFPEDVATALILRELDPSVDLFLPEQAELKERTNSEWQRIGAGGFLHEGLGSNHDPDQMSLFEAETDFLARNKSQRNIRSLERLTESINAFDESVIPHDESTLVFLIDCMSKTFSKRQPYISRRLRDRKRHIKQYLLSSKKIVY